MININKGARVNSPSEDMRWLDQPSLNSTYIVKFNTGDYYELGDLQMAMGEKIRELRRKGYRVSRLARKGVYALFVGL